MSRHSFHNPTLTSQKFRRNCDLYKCQSLLRLLHSLFRSYKIPPTDKNNGANTSDTIVINLIRILMDGPDVSLKGSPTVSPTTAALCASLPFPLWCPSSIYFLALSHAPPALEHKNCHHNTSYQSSCKQSSQCLRSKKNPHCQR